MAGSGGELADPASSSSASKPSAPVTASGAAAAGEAEVMAAQGGSGAPWWPRRWLDASGTAVARRIDALLLSLLVGNLSLLLVSTMPRSYFFGFKASLLKWMSKSLVYKAHIRAAPAGILVVAALIALAGRRAPRVALARWRSLAVAHGLLVYVQTRLYELIRGDERPALDLEVRANDRELENWEPVSQRTFAALTYLHRLVMPGKLLGTELLPVRRERLLFVGNHAVWGLDVPVLLHYLYNEEGVFPRPLGSHAWFAAPLLNELMKLLIGAVDGTEANCDLLMRRGQNLLVYPGGEREAWKKMSDTKYSLIWGENRGFARLALRHGYTIIPVATVGTEDSFEVVADFPLSKVLRLGGLIPAPKSKKVAGNAFMEGSTLPLLLPKVGELQKVYFKLGRPIPARLTAYGGLAAAGVVSLGDDDLDDFQSGAYQPTDAEINSLRDEVREALEREVSWLLEFRASDPDRFTPSRRRFLAAAGIAASGSAPKAEAAPSAAPSASASSLGRSRM